MSKKDFDKYYKEIESQYFEMLDDVKDMEEICSKGMVSPEQVETMKSVLEPIKNNYMTLSYVMFLMNKPTKVTKYDRYKSQNINLFNKSKKSEEVKEENSNCLNKLKKYKEELSSQ